MSWLPPSENPDVHPQKTNRSDRTCIQSYRLLTGVGTCQFLNYDVEPRVFTFPWNRYHQWLADIELIQISTFFGFLFQDEPVFHGWKAKRGWDLTLNSRTPKIVYCRIYSLRMDCHEKCILDLTGLCITMVDHTIHHFKIMKLHHIDIDSTTLHDFLKRVV